VKRIISPIRSGETGKEITVTKLWSHVVDEEEYTEVRIVSDEWFAAGIGVFDCMPVQGRFPDVTLELRWKSPPADFFQAGTLFTVSDHLKSVLEEFPIRAEFFPVKVVRQGGGYVERAYYFCNILDCVECFDLTRGKYRFWEKPGFTDRVDRIEELVIDEDKAAGHDLFRIAKGGEYIVCVSDRVASTIAERQLTGMRLVNPEDWLGS
jgi:hypothetical protein